MTDTFLDQQYAATLSGDEPAQLRFFDTLASTELFVVLKSEPKGDAVDLDVFETEDGTFLLAFDLEERMAEFVGAAAPYAALSGRKLIAMIARQGVGIALNPEVAASSQLIPSDAVDWIDEQLSVTAKTVGEKPSEITPPAELPEELLIALDQKLAQMGGHAKIAYLVGAQFGNRHGHMLAIIDAPREAEGSFVEAVSQSLAFSGMEAAALDVAFFDASDEISARLAKVGLRFDLPEIAADTSMPKAPGSDPDKPPRLK